MTVEEYREGLVQVAASVWDTMLHIALEAAGPFTPSPSPYTGTIYYTGSWKGALVLECSVEQAAHWVSLLMSLHPPLEWDDIRDGLGELTNMVAGNLKPLLPPGVFLSLPTVVAGRDYNLRFCGGTVFQTVVLEDPIGPFQITLAAALTP